MISAPRLCPKCGMEIPADAPEGACPGCLLENGLGLQCDESVTVRDSCTAAVAWAKTDHDAAAHDTAKASRAAEMLGELGDYELLERTLYSAVETGITVRSTSTHTWLPGDDCPSNIPALCD